MAHFHKVKLEIVRPGPPHNQLLSPLTPYMALCGDGSPITFHINLEHHKLVSRLQQLRYIVPEGGDALVIPDRMREAAVVELSEEVAKVLSDVRTLLAEVWRARCEGDQRSPAQNQIVHLRLVLGGSELALIPFEMALAPPAMPGEGLELALQLGMPVVPTRELRSSRLRPTTWNQKELKVLVVAAAPGGAQIPLAPHVHAIRAALEPWIEWPAPQGDTKEDPTAVEKNRLAMAKKRLRILTNASLDSIYKACSEEQFTHVHVLAHGGEIQVGGEQRFGVILCQSGNAALPEVVSGKRLAQALQAESEDGARRSQPVVVTLATCDSGNQSSVLIPGGSIAHDLHAWGIPWVFASQFPLTFGGSVRMAETLYPRLFRGDDPRQVIYEIRRQLFMAAQRDHDWASLIVYASIPDDLDDQVNDFFERQTRGAIETAFKRADQLNELNGKRHTEIREVLRQTEQHINFWESRLPDVGDDQNRKRRAECYGMKGSTYKRIAMILSRQESDTQSPSATPGEAPESESTIYYRKALEWYRKAMREGVLEGDKYHWPATQVLSLMAILKQPRDIKFLHSTTEIANQNLKKLRDPGDQAWAHGSLAELELLRQYHEPNSNVSEIQEAVRRHCETIIELTGQDSFHVLSTRRQFQRYVDLWRDEKWEEIANVAVNVLKTSA